jgi:NAD+ kinase
MQVLIYGTIAKEKDIPYIQLLFDVLHESNINAYVFKPYLNQIQPSIIFHRDIGLFDNYYDFKSHKIDFVITLGGDGTILSAVTLIRDCQTPILGINLGRLGYLADVEKILIKEAIISLQKGLYRIEERSMLHLESNQPLFGDAPYALNDFTILKRDTSSMITIHTYVNGAYLNSYWADGLIVATPTGSTGYSLSCGGPIIFPNSNNFVITPVAPHNLNVRPVVISDSAVISFAVEGRTDNFLCTLDSRFETITTEFQIAVRKCNFPLRLVQLQDKTFVKTLRKKLSWGMDSRN